MSVDDDTSTEAGDPPAPLAFTAREPAARGHRRAGLRRRRGGNRGRGPRVRKLRLMFVISAFLALAVISLLFGVLTSIASDLPQLRNDVQFSSSEDSWMYDVNGASIGPLAPASKPSIDDWRQISPNMRNAIVAVEDHGFWQESGISIRGLLRAAVSDLTGGQFQGGSTIAEEFVKNVRQEEGQDRTGRSVTEKLVEAGMAFQLSHHWTHAQILSQYLNTIYFGNGALGIEAAARVYFGRAYGYDAASPASEMKRGCGDEDPQNPHRRTCASMLNPAQAALLASVVANPTEFNPAGTDQERANALWRRNHVVLSDMYRQGYLTFAQYQRWINWPLPPRSAIQLPQQQPSAAPYFTSWVEPLVLHALEREGLSPKEAQYEADYGGLKIRLSLDMSLQDQAQTVIDDELPPAHGLPSASLVAIDNRSGEVRAMVSGDGDYKRSPFNLATMGSRQPGSSFKVFTLAAALAGQKVTPYTSFDSRPLTIRWFYRTPGNAVAAPNGTGRFPVHNFGNAYGGLIPMTVATATSDNSVFAQLGTEVGTGPIARYAKLLGIRSPISRNPSMILGGLTHGVSALDMAHAYSTIANGGRKVTNPTLGDVGGGPVGIDSISGCKPCRRSVITNAGTMSSRPVITPHVAQTIAYLLHGPVDDSYGTGTAAGIPGVDVAGKTGTTSDYIDAWFVGWTPEMTVAVWVGYPDTGTPMTDQYYGKPVEGGTFPAVIWRDYVTGALHVLAEEQAQRQEHRRSGQTVTIETPAVTGATAATITSTTGTQTTPSSGTGTANQTQTAPGASTGGPLTQTTPAASTPQTAPTVPQSTTPPAPAQTSTVGANGGSGL